MAAIKTKRLNLRLSDNRYAKLKNYADSKEKDITRVIEDWIDRLPNVGE